MISMMECGFFLQKYVNEAVCYHNWMKYVILDFKIKKTSWGWSCATLKFSWGCGWCWGWGVEIEDEVVLKSCILYFCGRVGVWV